MTRLFDALRLWAHYVRASARGQLQYRASVIMSIVGTFVITASEAVAAWALFARFGQLRGWTWPEVALFYGMSSIAWAICAALSKGFEDFSELVVSGEFDRVLLRPRSTVLQLLGAELTLRRIGRLVQGFLLLAYAAPQIAWTVPHVILLVLSIAGTTCAFGGIFVLQATSAFWTTTSLELWNAFTFGGSLMSQYPLSIYRSWFRTFFLFALPLGTTLYFPAVVLLDRPEPLGTPPILGWLAPLAGPAFLALCLQVWKLGVRRYRSTGS